MIGDVKSLSGIQQVALLIHPDAGLVGLIGGNDFGGSIQVFFGVIPIDRVSSIGIFAPSDVPNPNRSISQNRTFGCILPAARFSLSGQFDAQSFQATQMHDKGLLVGVHHFHRFAAGLA